MGRAQKITDEEIVAAARAALVEHGPNVSVAAIAARLNVSTTAVLKRIGSRDALVALALRPEGPAPFLARLREPVAREGLGDALVDVSSDAMEFFAGLVPLLVLVRTSNVDLQPLLRQPRPAGHAARRALAGWIEASRGCARAGDPDPTRFAEALLGAIESRCFHAWLERETPTRRERRAWLRQLVHGLWPTLAASR